MLRFRALNQESSDESEGEDDTPTVTREAQEQQAFSQYRTALSLLSKRKMVEAKNLLEEILDGDILPEIDLEENANHPLTVLKYSCLKNMGNVLAQQGDYENSLNHYVQAAKLDSSDVMLWYQLGKVALKLHNFELSRDAFLEGLNYSPSNWGCLNGIITVLYVLQDYVTCLVFISRAFEMDQTFIKGHAIRDAILRECPSIVSPSFLEGLVFSSQCAEYDLSIGEEIVSRAKSLRVWRKRKIDNESCIKYVPMSKPIISLSWQAVGNSLLHQYKIMQERLVIPLKLLHDPNDKFKESKEDLALQGIDILCEDNTPLTESRAILKTVEENQVEEIAELIPGQEGDDVKGRKRRRNSLLYVEQWVWGEKRRSARVRSTVRREAERVECNLGETLQRIMPQSLFPVNEKVKDTDLMKSNDDSMDTMDLYKMIENRENAENQDEKNAEQKSECDRLLNEEGYFGGINEESDVKNFLNMYNYQDILEIIHFYLHKLCEKWNLKWPEELIFLFLDIYNILRHHVMFPQVLCSEESSEWLERDALMTLLNEELSLDCWLKERISDKNTEISLGRRSVPTEEIGYLELILSRFSSNHLLRTRLYWLKAHSHLNDGDIEAATGCLEPLLRYLEHTNESEIESKIVLKNCSHNDVISKETVQQLLTALMRNQSLCEVQFLYEEKRYEELIEILKETFNYCQQPGLLFSCNSSVNVCPDRAAQLVMLMDAFRQQKEYQECFHWGEVCCNEALDKYLNSEEREQQKWATTLEKLLSDMESCVRIAGLSVVDGPQLSRLTSNLIRIMCHQLESPDTVISMPIESVSPWIILQQTLERENEKGQGMSSTEDQLPAYLNILFIAHEFLSRRSWCCSNEGALLLHTMDVVIPRLYNPELQGVYDKIVQGMEQVIFCLYAHPNKKAKLRSPLQDHGVPPVRLTWEHALKLFQFYLPRELPEFDSPRADSITTDVEVILKRIIGIVPAESNPAMMVEKMNLFVEGHIVQLPCPPGGYIPLPRQISAVFYLLADYYFKSNEWSKAIHHYLLDVCVNPVRLDSWAGMALARGSQLEIKLNSCEVLKSEAEFLRHAAPVQRCFQQSLKIQPRHLTLWIEYGSFAYMVHSFCSRLLKQETESLSLEMFDLLEKKKEEMLKHAVDCFLAALKVWYGAGENSGLQDERWLYHYMLGKTSEKYNKKPEVYLDHYLKACHFLHINKASYSRKISYKNPQNFSVEALEVFYRIHACILKWLEQNEGKAPDQSSITLFQRYLQAAQQGPFMSNFKDLEGHQDSDEDKYSVSVCGKWIPNFDEKDVIPKEGLNRTLEDIVRDVMQPSDGFFEKDKENESGSKTEVKDNKEVPASDDSEVDESNSIDSSSYKRKETVKCENELADECKGSIKMNEEKEDAKEASTSEVTKVDETPVVSQGAVKIISENEDENTNTSIDDGSQGKENTLVEESKKDIIKGDCPEELTTARRSSQESSTTGTTETSGGNSSSSSDNSSSSDDSSESGSSSSESSDDESAESRSTDAASVAVTITEKTKEKVSNDNTRSERPMNEPVENSDWKKVHEELIQCCIVGLEECVLRFPQHYKSLYRLTHYFFRSKSHKDINKCRDLLLENYTCSHRPGRPIGASFQGLFADRKNNNFFNGVWRIPVSDVDRPGNFASHMSRCVSLLMDVLLELKDHGMLLELCLQLRRTPDPDKKYLRDSEREQLSRQALSLAIQTLRNCIQEGGISLLLDVYKAYQRIQKHLPAKESIFASLLIDAYKKSEKAKNAELETVVLFCQQQLSLRRNSSSQPGGSSNQNVVHIPETSSLGFLEGVSLGTSNALKSPSVSSPALTGRPRGRPPNSAKIMPPFVDDNPFFDNSSLNAKRSMNWLDSLPKGILQQQHMLQQQHLLQQQLLQLQQQHLQQQLQQQQQQQQQQLQLQQQQQQQQQQHNNNSVQRPLVHLQGKEQLKSQEQIQDHVLQLPQQKQYQQEQSQLSHLQKPQQQQQQKHQLQKQQKPLQQQQQQQQFLQMQQLKLLQQQLQQLQQFQQEHQKLSLNKGTSKPSNLVPDYNAIHSIFSDPNFLSSALKGKFHAGADSQTNFDFYQAQLNQSTFQTELLCQLARNLSIPQMSLFNSVSGVPVNPNQLNPCNFKSDRDSTPPQVSNTVTDYIKDRPNISITPITNSNASLKHKSNPPSNTLSVSHSNSSFGASIPEKSSRPSSTFISNTGQGSSTSFKDSKYVSPDSFSNSNFKSKDFVLTSGGKQNQGLTISPSTSIINVSSSKSTNYKKQLPNQGSLLKSGSFVPDSYGNVSSTSTDNKSTDVSSTKTEHKSGVSSGHRHLTSNLHVNPDKSVSPQNSGLPLFPQRSKDLQIIPMTQPDNSISIHPVSSNYKQVPFSADKSAEQDKEIDLAVNYSPPVKKVKDTVTITEVPIKKTLPTTKIDEPSTALANVEIITLE